MKEVKEGKRAIEESKIAGQPKTPGSAWRA
jgi:hypothetical protein